MNQLTPSVDSLCEEIYSARENFYKHSLLSLITFKVFLGRKLSSASESIVQQVAEKTGISETILFDCQKLYKVAELSPAKEKKFIKEFPENFSSWNDCRKKLLAPKSTGGEKDNCRHCPEHCLTK